MSLSHFLGKGGGGGGGGVERVTFLHGSICMAVMWSDTHLKLIEAARGQKAARGIKEVGAGSELVLVCFAR